jgi:hypothetical protein
MDSLLLILEKIIKLLTLMENNKNLSILLGIHKNKLELFILHDEKKHGLSDGDTVTFREVKGMEEINGK